ncbi:MAG: hypothetical protein CR965_00810 [Paludibacter sp.]|nr:MAG: hypothetical protein CR965_00810 [Paludibacter sp.]
MKYLNYFFLFFILFQITSCQKENKNLEMKTFSFEKKYPFKDTINAGKLDFIAEIELPIKYKNKEVADNIRKQIIGKIFGEFFNSIQIENLLSTYGKMLHNEYKRVNNSYFESLDTITSDNLINNEISIQGVAMFLDEKILSYSYERYSYFGGNEGSSFRIFLNFNLKTSELIKEKDIFKHGYQESLTQLLKEQIVEDNANIESVADLSELNYFEDKIKPNDNFYLTAEGLVYVYNPYDIASYSIGQIEVLIPFEKLKPIMKPNNIFEYIYKK